jgi:hypothetical protein
MLITVPLGLGLAELVVEQAPPDGDPLQVAGPREVLDLVLEQHRPTLGVDQGAVEIRLLAEDGRGAVHVGVGLEDQHLDDHDQADQHPAQGELERAPPPAQDALRVGHARGDLHGRDTPDPQVGVAAEGGAVREHDPDRAGAVDRHVLAVGLGGQQHLGAADVGDLEVDLCHR